MFNQFTGIGNLAADPETRETQSGTQVTNFTVCCDSGWGDNKHTEFVRCVAWAKLAGVVSQYLHKGSKCFIQGEMQTRKWQDQNGQDRYSTEIVVRDMKMLDSRGQNTGGQPMKGSQYEQSTGEGVPF